MDSITFISPCFVVASTAANQCFIIAKNINHCFIVAPIVAQCFVITPIINQCFVIAPIVKPLVIASTVNQCFAIVVSIVPLVIVACCSMTAASNSTPLAIAMASFNWFHFRHFGTAECHH